MTPYHELSYNDQQALLRDAPDAELRALGILAIGRMLNIASRPFQDGDEMVYEQAKAVLIDTTQERKWRAGL